MNRKDIERALFLDDERKRIIATIEKSETPIEVKITSRDKAGMVLRQFMVPYDVIRPSIENYQQEILKELKQLDFVIENEAI